MVENIWKKHHNIMEEGISYIRERAKGTIKSLKTQWTQFNKIGLNGIEWNSSVILASRPGVGKTLLVNSLSRSVLELNKDQDFAVLHFQFEMLGRNLALREYSSATGLNIRYLQSVKDDGFPPLNRENYEKLLEYQNSQKDREEYIIDTPMSVLEMQNNIYKFYRFIKKPFVITLDHTLLVSQDASEQSKQITLQNLAIMMTNVKNKLPVTFIILTQLNREMDNPERQIPGKLSNFPTESDVFGSDYLLQCSDVMMAYNRPAKYNISLYGPQKYIITDDDKFLLACHVLKNRFGDVGIDWYKAEYSKMTIIETTEPNKKIII